MHIEKRVNSFAPVGTHSNNYAHLKSWHAVSNDSLHANRPGHSSRDRRHSSSLVRNDVTHHCPCVRFMSELIEAGAKLSLVRATICRELRHDRDWVVIEALLKAEELVKEELKVLLAFSSDKVII